MLELAGKGVVVGIIFASLRGSPALLPSSICTAMADGDNLPVFTPEQQAWIEDLLEKRAGRSVPEESAAGPLGSTVTNGGMYTWLVR